MTLSQRMSKRILAKWRDSLVAVGRKPAYETVDEFERVLSDAGDERPMQTLLASSPALLGPLAPIGNSYWCLNQPRLGAEHIPDFLLASDTSVGFRWAMIELESPRAKALTRFGLPARKLAEALGQVRDWRMWLTENIAYARDGLGLLDIDGNCPAFVVIGRRSSLDPKQIGKYRGLSTEGLTVMSYDRLQDLLTGSAYRIGARDG